MTAKLPAENPGDNANNAPTQSSVLPLTLPLGSLGVLTVLAIIALALMILPRPTLYYPKVVVDAIGGMKLDFLLNGRQDKAACDRTANSL